MNKLQLDHPTSSFLMFFIFAPLNYDGKVESCYFFFHQLNDSLWNDEGLIRILFIDVPFD